MEIDISNMNIPISIMKSHTPIMIIYIFIRDTHYFILDEYGWRCNSFNMQLCLHRVQWKISITELWTDIIDLWISLIVNYS